MKKTILILTSMLLCITSVADVVKKSEAANVAKNFLGGLDATETRDIVQNNTEQTAYYLFNGNGRWAIVSADDCATPILMHGEGNIDMKDIPDNMKSLLSGIAKDILKARDNSMEQDPSIKEKWNRLSTEGPELTTDQIVLPTATWHQNSPFNNNCPIINGQRSVTGCVATSTAIVMQYNKWPVNPTDTIPAYVTHTYKLEIPEIALEGYTYDWSLMPNNIYFNSPQEQKDAVAALMFHLGAMVEMDYSPNSSSAIMNAVLPALVKYMHYSPAARSLNRSGFSNSDWFNMLKAEIDANRPIIYSGVDIDGKGGHQFVCDGYNSDEEIHINWGWGGYSDAWYAVSYLGPTGDKNYVFSRSDSAIFGLVPDPDGTGQAGDYLSFGSNYQANGVILYSGTIEKDRDFKINICAITNNSTETYTGSFGVALVGKDGTLKEIISKYPTGSNLQSGYHYPSIIKDCRISSDIVFGDRICAIYTNTKAESEEWIIVNPTCSVDKLGNYMAGSLGAIDITMIDIPSEIHAGETIYPSLLFGQKAPIRVTWYLDGNALERDYFKLLSGTHELKASLTYSDGSSETVRKKLTAE